MRLWDVSEPDGLADSLFHPDVVDHNRSPDRASASQESTVRVADGRVAHASTTSGYVIGHREEAAVVERLSQRFDVPAVPS